MQEKNEKGLLRIWTLLFVLLLILLMTVPARADVGPRYYSGLKIPFHLFERSEVKIFLHSKDGLKKSLTGTFVLDEGSHSVKTLKNGIYSLEFSTPADIVVKKKRLSKKELKELKLATLMREVKKKQSVAAQ